MGQVYVRASRRARAHTRKGTSTRRLSLNGNRLNTRQFNRDYRPRVPQGAPVWNQVRAGNIKKLRRTSMSVKARRSFAHSIRFTKG